MQKLFIIFLFAYTAFLYSEEIQLPNDCALATFSPEDLKEEISEFILCTPSHAIAATFEYDAHKRMTKKSLPENRFLNIQYIQRGSDKGSVESLSAPVGSDNTPVITHTFNYKEGSTDVQDAHHNLTRYNYHKKDKRLSNIVKYDERKAVYSEDHFFWSNEGDLLARYFKGDRTFFRKLTYDRFGNVTKDTLWGQLTGKNTPELTLQAGTPVNNGCETYTKRYVYSHDGWHHLLEEHEEQKSTFYTYRPDSNLIIKKLIKSGNTILKREFFDYDTNGTLILEICDNGSDTEKDNLTGVTQRTLKTITPTQQEPFGLPAIIEERYLDLATGTYPLLSKTFNDYSPQGKRIRQLQCGSDGSSSYTLYWEYDQLGNVTKEVDALGHVTLRRYDKNGNKIYEQDPLFHKNFTYDFANRLIKEEEVWQDGTLLTTHHQYNTLSQRTATIDPSGHKTSYEYDPFGRLVKIIHPPISTIENSWIQPVETFKYDSLGNQVEKWDANGNVTQIAYTIRGEPTRITYSDGTVEQKLYTLEGLLETEIAKNGLTTTYIRDPFGNVIRTEIRDHQGTLLKTRSAQYDAFHLLAETDEAGVTTHYQYDGAGRKISETVGDHLITYRYDPLGRLTHTIEEDQVTVQEYDTLNRIIEKRVEDISGTTFWRETYGYDAHNNRTQLRQYLEAGIALTQKTFTPRNTPLTIIDPLENTTHFHYDYQHETGLRVTRTDPLGRQAITQHNALGHVILEMQLDPFLAPVQSDVHYTDGMGNRLRTESFVYGRKTPPVLTEWQYDSLGRQIQVTEARGTPEQKQTHITYNSAGQKEHLFTANGIRIRYRYDPLGRLIQCTSSNHTIGYQYQYDIKDRLTMIQDQVHNTCTLRSYDLYGNLLSEQLDHGSVLTYQYDPLDRLISIRLPDASRIQYTYLGNQLASVERQGPIGSYTHHYVKYDLAGNLLVEQLPVSGGTIQHQYDLLQRPICVQAPYWKESIPEGGYDPCSRLLRRKVVDTAGPLAYTYSYDALNQLTAETGVETHLYQNDSLYNRIEKDQQPHQINARNQLLDNTQSQYRYDNSGNLIEKKEGEHITRYRYDAFDRLTAVEDDSHQIQYTYDSFHRRISKSVDGKITYFLYQGDNEIGALVDGQLTELRVLGHGVEVGAAIALELQGKVYLPIHDPWGNVVTLLNTSGRSIESYRYTAFGETTNSKKTPWQYASKRFDPETGLVYFGRRYYEPQTGRWITPDPLGFEDGLNQYAYVHNNPLAYVDPDGQFAFLLLPLAISMVADYVLPSAVVMLQEYTGCAMAAGLLSGLVQGYNGGALGSVNLVNDPWGSVAENVGVYLGTALSCMPGKVAANACKAGASAVQRVVSAASLKVVAANSEKAFTSIAKGATSQATKQTAIAAERHFVSGKTLNLDQLSKAGQVMDRGGLTKAGRALDKHGGRPGSVFPKAIGNPASKNAQGQFHLDDILTHPQSVSYSNRFGGKDIFSPDGRGVRFDADDNVLGFLQPKGGK